MNEVSLDREPATGFLPRRITSSTMWTGGCIDFPYRGERIHSHMSAYAIKGSRKTMMIDSGHPHHADTVMSSVVEFLDGRPLDLRTAVEN